MSRTAKGVQVQLYRSVGPRRGGTPGEALAGTEDTRQGWIYGAECSPRVQSSVSWELFPELRPCGRPQQRGQPALVPIVPCKPFLFFFFNFFFLSQ